MERFISARIDKRNGHILHKVETTIGTVERPYRTIRAGVSWPTTSSPSYVCIVGSENLKNSSGEYPIRLLSEAESENLSDFLNHLMSEATKFCCGIIIADRADQYLPYVKEFDSFCRKREVDAVPIIAPLWAGAEYFKAGTYLIDKALKENTLEIGEECKILRRQLGQLTNDALQDEKVAAKFYAVNALRLLLNYYSTSNSDSSMTAEEAARLKAKHSRYGRGFETVCNWHQE